MKISVILPAYNAERYLDDAIQSIANQTYTDWELIVIDDASNDSTAEIAEKWAHKFPDRIRVIRLDRNRGLSGARNVGLDHVSGEIIACLDSDDEYLSDAFEKMATLLSDHPEVDVVCGKITQVRPLQKPATARSDSDRKMTAEPLQTGFRILSAEEALDHALYQDGLVDHSAWGKLYRSQLFKDLRYREGIWYEDLHLFPRLMYRARKVAVMAESVYFYRQHPESFIHKWHPTRLDSVKVTDDILKFVHRKFPRLEKAARNRRVSASLAAFVLGKNHKEELAAEQAWEIICNERRGALTDPRVRMKNKLALALSYFGPKPLLLLSTLFKKYR